MLFWFYLTNLEEKVFEWYCYNLSQIFIKPNLCRGELEDIFCIAYTDSFRINVRTICKNIKARRDEKKFVPYITWKLFEDFYMKNM